MLPIIRKKMILCPPPVPPQGGSDSLGYQGIGKKPGKKGTPAKPARHPLTSIATGIVVRLPGTKKSIMANLGTPAAPVKERKTCCCIKL
jgi:hypothetical protein